MTLHPIAVRPDMLLGVRLHGVPETNASEISSN